MGQRLAFAEERSVRRFRCAEVARLDFGRAGGWPLADLPWAERKDEGPPVPQVLLGALVP